MFQVKLANNFRTIANVDKIDWCYIMEKANSITNVYMKALIKDMKKSLPRLFDPCPFSGLVQLLNVPPQEKLMSILPGKRNRTC